MNSLFKKWRRDRRSDVVVFVVLEFSDCRQVGGGGLGQKVLFRAS